MSRNVRLAMRLAACRTGLLLVAALCATPGYADSLDELYQLAKQEKTLVMWAAGPSAGYERAARAFEQRFPGITVSLKGGFSNVLNTQIEQQVSADKVETDVVVLQTNLEFLTNENLTELRRRFESYTGPVTNVGDVR